MKSVSIAYALPVACAPDLTRVAFVDDTAAFGRLAHAADADGGSSPVTPAQRRRPKSDMPSSEAASSGQQADLLIKLGRARGAAGWLQQCCDGFDEALRLLPADSSLQGAEAASVFARLQRQLGRADLASALIRAELEALAHSDSADSAFLAFEAACAELDAGSPAASCRHAAIAMAAADHHNLRALRVAAMGVAIIANCFAGSIPAAEEELRGAVSLMDDLSDNELAERPDAAMLTGWAEFFLEKHQNALDHFNRAVALGDAMSHYPIVYHATVGQVLVLCAAGQLAAAAARADDAVAAAGGGELRDSAVALRCLVAARAGDQDLLRHYSPAGIFPVADGWFSALTLGSLAEARLAVGDPEGCLDLLVPAAEPGSPFACPGSRAGWFELLTRAALSAGHYDAASGWALRVEELAQEFALAGCRGFALLARAHVLVRRDPVACASTAFAAARELNSAGLISDAARARAVARMALRAGGEPPQAEPAVPAKAREARTESGVGLIAAPVAVQRQRPGNLRAVRTPRPRIGIGALTSRELQAAELVRHGLTNRQIAMRLFVTEKTVEMHLSNTFAKLGVPNRVGLVRELNHYSAGPDGGLFPA